MNPLDHFYLNHEEPNQSCLMALRSLILEQDSLLVETLKYGMPCFMYKKKACCYLWVDKKTSEPYILFVEGEHLAFPDLEAGSRSRMKIFRVNPNEDIPVGRIQEILNYALDLYRKGTVLVDK